MVGALAPTAALDDDQELRSTAQEGVGGDHGRWFVTGHVHRQAVMANARRFTPHADDGTLRHVGEGSIFIPGQDPSQPGSFHCPIAGCSERADDEPVAPQCQIHRQYMVPDTDDESVPGR